MGGIKKTKAFTLIEVVVAMAIVAVLAMIIIGSITAARRASVETANYANSKVIHAGLEAYYGRYKRYCDPPSPTQKIPCGTYDFAEIQSALSDAGVLAVNSLSGGAHKETGGGQVTINVPTCFYMKIYNWDAQEYLKEYTGGIDPD